MTALPNKWETELPLSLGAMLAAAGVRDESAPVRSEFAPLPEFARLPELPSKGYLLDDLGAGLYGVRDGRFQAMFLVTRRGVVVVDNPPSFGETMPAAIGEVTDNPVTHFVYSHAHADHTAGAALFGENVEYVAHELTADLLRRADDPRRPVPTVTFSGRKHELRTGGKRLVLDCPGTFHQQGNLLVHAPEQRVLMFVDVISPGWSPFFRLGLTADVGGFVEVHDIVGRYDFTTFIGGHPGHFGTREDVEVSAAYLRDLRAAVEEAFRTLDYAAAVRGVEPGNTFALFKVFTDALSDRAAELMLAGWSGRLAATDVFLRDNASAMIYHMLLD